MTQSSDSNRLDRLEAIVEDLVESIAELRDSQRNSETRIENLAESVAELRDSQRHSETRIQNVVESIARLRDSQLEVQQEHLQVLRIVAQQQNEIVRTNNEIAGLRTESLRILEHLFASQQGG